MSDKLDGDAANDFATAGVEAVCDVVDVEAGDGNGVIVIVVRANDDTHRSRRSGSGLTGFGTTEGDSKLVAAGFGGLKCVINDGVAVVAVGDARLYEIKFSFGFGDNFESTIFDGFRPPSLLNDQFDSVSDFVRLVSAFRWKSSKSRISSKSVPSLPAPKSGK